MWNKARGLWFKPHDTVHLMDNKKRKLEKELVTLCLSQIIFYQFSSSARIVSTAAYSYTLLIYTATCVGALSQVYRNKLFIYSVTGSNCEATFIF